MPIITNSDSNVNNSENAEAVELDEKKADLDDVKKEAGNNEQLESIIQFLELITTTKDSATFDVIEVKDKFDNENDKKMVITHEATVGDLLVAALLAINVFVLVLSRAIKGGKRR